MLFRSLALNNLVEQYLIFAAGQAIRRIPMNMYDWIKKLNGFLKLNDRDILDHAGKISHQIATELAEKQYQRYKKKHSRLSSRADEDFDKMVKKLIRPKKKQP